MSITLTNDIVMEMAKAGVLFGHKRSKTHPRMKPYVAGNRNEMEVLDPEATFASLEKAAAFLKEKVTAGGLLLVVGTQATAREMVEQFAKEFNAPYVTSRWLGGTLTNHKVINARLQYYEDLKAKKERGELAKYTKKEQHQFSEEIGKLSKFFDGLSNLKKLPDALIVVDVNVHETAVREAARLRIPTVGILDTNDDPKSVEYPIFANDHTKASIEWIFGKLQSGIKE